MLIKDERKNARTAAFHKTVSLRCPGCGQNGSMQPLQNQNDIVYDHLLPDKRGVEPRYLAQRFCPNDKCRTHVFVVANQDGTVLVSYPPSRVDFDSSGIPEKIAKSLDEALTCLAHGCYIAAAIMVRKTMEELCADQNATGKNLKDRIVSLGAKVTLPPALITAIDNVRLLGNDAAHIESEHFNNVGEAELQAAILLAKEVLKGVYQYQELIKQLESLKKLTP